MKTLRQYTDAADPKRTRDEWAAFFDMSGGHFTDLLNGRAFPSRKVIMRIAEITGGEVPPAVWFLPETSPSEYPLCKVLKGAGL